MFLFSAVGHDSANSISIYFLIHFFGNFFSKNVTKFYKKETISIIFWSKLGGKPEYVNPYRCSVFLKRQQF